MLKKTIGAVALASAALALTAPAAAAGPHHGGNDPCERRTNGSLEKLLECVGADGASEHLEAFQEIADANGGTRASGTPGYDASAEYVAQQMRKAGYTVTIEPFSVDLFSELSESVLEQTSPAPTTYENGGEPGFSTMEYSGSGDVTAAAQAVDVVVPAGAAANTSTSGCEAEDFADFTAGNIALLQRGTCDFGVKAANAEAAGAVGAVIFNEGQEGRTDNLLATLGGAGVTIPVVGASYEIGAELVAADAAELRLAVDAQVATRETSNVIAESSWGDPDNVVMAGAHLDSVAEGSGINDNGSGSAAILDVAEAMSKVRGENKLRFAWWGAEESGLIGSYEYTGALSDDEIEDIALYLNFDMVASPNHIFGVYDGDGSDFGLAGPEGSDSIEATFEEYFERAGEASQGTEFSGRSDYAGFIDVGIPSGGLFTGAEGIKTEEEAALYGGTAGEAYDPCYHSACDDLSNVNVEALDTNVDAIAYSLLTYVRSTEDVNGVVPDKGPGKGHGKHWGDKGHGKGDQRPGRSGWDD